MRDLVEEEEEAAKVHAHGHVGGQDGVGRLHRRHEGGDAVGEADARHGREKVDKGKDKEGALARRGAEIVVKVEMVDSMCMWRMWHVHACACMCMHVASTVKGGIKVDGDGGSDGGGEGSDGGGGGSGDARR